MTKNTSEEEEEEHQEEGGGKIVSDESAEIRTCAPPGPTTTASPVNKSLNSSDADSNRVNSSYVRDEKPFAGPETITDPEELTRNDWDFDTSRADEDTHKKKLSTRSPTGSSPSSSSRRSNKRVGSTTDPEAGTVLADETPPPSSSQSAAVGQPGAYRITPGGAQHRDDDDFATSADAGVSVSESRISSDDANSNAQRLEPQVDNAFIAVATLVPDEDENQEGDHRQENHPHTSRYKCVADFRNRKVQIGLFLVLSAIIVAVVVVLVVLLRDGGGSEGDGDSTSNDPPDILSRSDQIKNRILEISDASDINNPVSHQREALTWITEVDTAHLSASDDRLIQRYVVALLYFSLSGPNWTRSQNWLGPFHECSWANIGCDETNRFVTALSFGENNMVGILPPEIVALASLKNATFFGNTIEGEMPTTMGSLSGLEYLDLKETQISGAIPREIGQLSQMKYLRLSNTMLSGDVPLNEICNLTQLNLLELGTDDPRNVLNYLTRLPSNFARGLIPKEIGNLRRLKYLRLNALSLTGTIPTEIGNLSGLLVLTMYSNYLAGIIPPELGDLSNLQMLRLNQNFLTGTVPTSLASLRNLATLRLEVNEGLHGTLPAEICTDTKVPDVWGVWITCNVGCCGLMCCSICDSRPTQGCS